MLAFDRDQHRLVGPHGSLPILEEDDITRKLAMLIEGECDALGPRQAAETFGFSKSQYYQIEVVEEFGCSAWSAVCLGVQSEMNTSTETHLAPWFHGNLSAESISRVWSKSAVD